MKKGKNKVKTKQNVNSKRYSSLMTINIENKFCSTKPYGNKCSYGNVIFTDVKNYTQKRKERVLYVERFIPNIVQILLSYYGIIL